MKLKMIIKGSNSPFVLPINYNHILQATILKWINDKNYSEFIHSKGYRYSNSIYKMYTFSNLNGVYKINKYKKQIIFYDEIELAISSIDAEFLIYLLNNVIKKNLYIFKQKVDICSIESIKIHSSKKEQVKMISPVTVHSTFLNNLGNKKTLFYNPKDSDFSVMIKNNLIKKYNAINNTDIKKEDENFEFNIKVKNVNRLKKRVVNYKQFYIDAYIGEFNLEGNSELMQIAYDTGIGARNSAGFGMIERISERS